MAKQLTVLIENRPGALAELTKTIGKANVNITAIMLEGSLDFGVARIHVDQVQKAVKALEADGFQVQAGEALVLDLENKPGELARLCEKLGKAKINIESIFGTTGRSDTPTLVLKVDDPRKALEVLGK